MTNPKQPCELRSLGIQPYEKVWKQMQAFTQDRTEQTLDQMWLLQHEPVYTLGQAGKPEHILNAHNIPVVKTDRGGQVTYHGPGQLIIYFMLNVRRRGYGVRTLVDVIESSILELLGSYNIRAELQKGAPGVYVQSRKIAALGLRIRRGCSFHGLSLNIDMDLEPFQWINPCGYEGLEVTQLADYTSKSTKELFIEAEQRLVGALQSRLL